MKQAYKLSMTKEENYDGRELRELYITFNLEVLDLGFKQWLQKSNQNFLYKQRKLLPMLVKKKWFKIWTFDFYIVGDPGDSSSVRTIRYSDLISGHRIQFYSEPLGLAFISEFASVLTEKIDEQLKQYKKEVGYGDYSLDDASQFMLLISLKEKEKLIDLLSKHIETEASKSEQEAEKFEETELIFNIRKRLIETTKYR